MNILRGLLTSNKNPGQSGALSCAVRHDIISRTVRNTWAVHPFATGVSTTDNTATRDWLTNNLLGVSEFSNGLAANMTSIVRSRFNIEDRIRRAWYIHPGHRWPTVPGKFPIFIDRTSQLMFR